MDQPDLFEAEATRSLLSRLFIDSQLYRRSSDYLDLLNFVVRMKNFAPFNAMLLQVQKPGLRFAASAHDWEMRFGRQVVDGARPLLIMWMFGPVALVYDLMDTSGTELPKDAEAFYARGPVTETQLAKLRGRLSGKHIDWITVDAGDNKAGSIRRAGMGKEKEPDYYRLVTNRNHGPPTQLATVAHELGHLFLGHLGGDQGLKIPSESVVSVEQREIEAESVSYIICNRNGIESRSKSYLASYIEEHATIDHLDVYKVMRAAGQVETLMGLSVRTQFDRPVRKGRAGT